MQRYSYSLTKHEDVLLQEYPHAILIPEVCFVGNAGECTWETSAQGTAGYLAPGIKLRFLR